MKISYQRQVSDGEVFGFTCPDCTDGTFPEILVDDNCIEKGDEEVDKVLTKFSDSHARRHSKVRTRPKNRTGKDY